MKCMACIPKHERRRLKLATFSRPTSHGLQSKAAYVQCMAHTCWTCWLACHRFNVQKRWRQIDSDSWDTRGSFFVFEQQEMRGSVSQTERPWKMAFRLSSMRDTTSKPFARRGSIVVFSQRRTSSKLLSRRPRPGHDYSWSVAAFTIVYCSTAYDSCVSRLHLREMDV